MLIIKSIAYITIIVWLIIPVRQFKTRFFLFFLILGLLDPTAYILGHIFKLNIAVPHLLGTIILLYPALFEIKKNQAWAYPCLIYYGSNCRVLCHQYFHYYPNGNSLYNFYFLSKSFSCFF